MRIVNRVHIDAPVAVVWNVTENVSASPEWTPTVTSAHPLTEGPFDIGSRDRLKQPLQPTAIWEVTACTKGKSFTWENAVLSSTTAVPINSNPRATEHATS